MDFFSFNQKTFEEAREKFAGQLSVRKGAEPSMAEVQEEVRQRPFRKVYSKTKRDVEDTDGNSDDSFHSVYSETSSTSPKPARRSFQIGDFVEDIVSHKQNNMTARQARELLNMAASPRISEPAKFRTLAQLNEAEMELYVAKMLIVPSGNLITIEQLAGRLVRLKVDENLEENDRCLEAALRLFSKCLKLTASDVSIRSVVKSSCASNRFQIHKDLFRLSDLSHNKIRSEDICIQMLHEAQDWGEEGMVKGTLYRAASLGGVTADCASCLGLAPISLFFADNPMVIKWPDHFYAILQCQVFQKNDEIVALEDVWLANFPEHISRHEVKLATAEIMDSGFDVHFKKIYPTGHAVVLTFPPRQFYAELKALEAVLKTETVFKNKRRGSEMVNAGDCVSLAVNFLCHEEDKIYNFLFARGVVVTMGQTRGDVYLFDFGVIVEVFVDELVRLPQAATQIPPLIRFVKIQGVGGNPNRICNLAAEILYRISDKDSVYEVDGAFRVDNSLFNMLASGKKYLQLASVKYFRFLYERMHSRKEVLANTIHREFCSNMVRFLNEREVNLKNEDALVALCCCLDLLPEDTVRFVFENENILALARNIEEQATSESTLRNSVCKILDMTEKGNFFSHLNRVSELQVRVSELQVEQPRNRCYQDTKQPRALHTQPQRRSGGGHTLQERRTPPGGRRSNDQRPAERNQGKYGRIMLSTRDVPDLDNDSEDTDPEDDQAQDKAQIMREQIAKPYLFKGEILGIKKERKAKHQMLMAEYLDQIKRDEFAKHLVAFLNAGVHGSIVVGVHPDTLLIHGIRLDRKLKDRFRQEFDHVVGRLLKPKPLSNIFELNFCKLVDQSRAQSKNPEDPCLNVIEIKVNAYEQDQIFKYEDVAFVRFKGETVVMTPDILSRLTIAEVDRKKKTKQ